MLRRRSIFRSSPAIPSTSVDRVVTTPKRSISGSLISLRRSTSEVTWSSSTASTTSASAGPVDGSATKHPDSSRSTARRAATRGSSTSLARPSGRRARCRARRCPTDPVQRIRQPVRRSRPTVQNRRSRRRWRRSGPNPTRICWKRRRAPTASSTARTFVVGAARSAVTWEFTVGASGEVATAYGPFAVPVDVADVSLIDVETAIGRLHALHPLVELDGVTTTVFGTVPPSTVLPSTVPSSSPDTTSVRAGKRRLVRRHDHHHHHHDGSGDAGIHDLIAAHHVAGGRGCRCR